MMNKSSDDLSYIGGYASLNRRGELCQVQPQQAVIIVAILTQY